MPFLDDFDKKLTILGKGALLKTKEVTDTAKISSAIRGLEAQRKDTLCELGNKYYELHKTCGETPQQVILEIISKIDAIDMQINQNRNQLQKIKGTIYCPNCNAQLTVDSIFCSSCGTKIEQNSSENTRTNSEQEERHKKCTNCGRVLESDQTFCVYCGTKVEM